MKITIAFDIEDGNAQAAADLIIRALQKAGNPECAQIPTTASSPQLTPTSQPKQTSVPTGVPISTPSATHNTHTTAAPNTIQQPPVQDPPTYTLDQLQLACAPLMDAGRQLDLIALLNSFGVQAMTQLPKVKYGEFATALRQLGAKI